MNDFMLRQFVLMISVINCKNMKLVCFNESGDEYFVTCGINDGYDPLGCIGLLDVRSNEFVKLVDDDSISMIFHER